MPQPVAGPLGPFQVLGLAPRLRWEQGELLGVYERLARRCHPDLFRAHRDDRVLSAAKSATRALNDSYRLVRDIDSRLRYVLSTLGHSQHSTRTVPEGLQDSAQILERVFARVEEARQKSDRAAWEAQQDHAASLEVKVEAARERCDQALRALAAEWDAAVAAEEGDWPSIGEDWIARALTLAGERAYLRTIEARLAEARRWPAEATV